MLCVLVVNPLHDSYLPLAAESLGPTHGSSICLRTTEAKLQWMGIAGNAGTLHRPYVCTQQRVHRSVCLWPFLGCVSDQMKDLPPLLQDERPWQRPRLLTTPLGAPACCFVASCSTDTRCWPQLVPYVEGRCCLQKAVTSRAGGNHISPDSLSPT